MTWAQHKNAKTLPRSLCSLQQLEGKAFDALFYSPLKRAAATAQVVWGERPGPQYPDPVLREVDLYSFQVGGLAWSPH